MGSLWDAEKTEWKLTYMKVSHVVGSRTKNKKNPRHNLHVQKALSSKINTELYVSYMLTNFSV